MDTPAAMVVGAVVGVGACVAVVILAMLRVALSGIRSRDRGWGK